MHAHAHTCTHIRTQQRTCSDWCLSRTNNACIRFQPLLATSQLANVKSAKHPPPFDEPKRRRFTESARERGGEGVEKYRRKEAGMEEERFKNMASNCLMHAH